MKLPPGFRLGPHTLGHPVGRGATAVVYQAVDPEGQPVAVKVRARSHTSRDRRFLREFESLRALRVPGVVGVKDAGIQGELIWYAMNLVEGRPFTEVPQACGNMRERIRRTLHLGRQLLEVLAELHGSGLVHRDIKPSNVLVDEEDRVWVLDFGIARFFAETETDFSDLNRVLGTVPYMAPEQLTGMPSDRKVDLYAAGLLLYEAVNGPRPKPEQSMGWMTRICADRLVPLACLHREVPRGFSALVEELTSVEPTSRPDASRAASELRRLQHDEPSRDWPEPSLLELGEQAFELDGCLGLTDGPRMQVLSGPAGSGRRRLAEQVQRTALLQGTWVVHGRCHVDRLGGVLEELLATVLGTGADDKWATKVAARDAPLLLRLWPDLPLPAPEETGGLPSASEVAQAVARTLARAGRSQPLLLLVHQLEHADDLTLATLEALGKIGGDTCGLLLLYDPRWKTVGVEDRINVWVHDGLASQVTPEPLTADQARALAAALVPKGDPPKPGDASAQHAVDAGTEALAAWRGEAWQAPEEVLWPMALREGPIPDRVLMRLVGRPVFSSPWIRRDEEGSRLDSRFARNHTLQRIPRPRKAAATVADAWSTVLADRADPADLAELWLLAGQPDKAAEPLARAALAAGARQSYAEARRYLVRLEQLRNAPIPQNLAFELALTRAQVVLEADPIPFPRELLERCEKLAETPAHKRRARLLAAEVRARSGDFRGALVAALRLASRSRKAEPLLAARTLLAATRWRLAMKQYSDADAQLGRAHELMKGEAATWHRIQLDDLRAELLLHRHRLLESRALTQAVLRRAAEQRALRLVATASDRLARLLRMKGRRREAELHARGATEGFQATGDVASHAGANLLQATLEVERGNPALARHLCDRATRRVRALRLDHLLPIALRVALQIAVFRADPDARVWVTELEALRSPDPETAAVLCRWWRSHGELDRALRVPAPPSGGYPETLWRLERAKTALQAERRAVASNEAEEARLAAARLGFEELELHASLLEAFLGHVPDEGWRLLLHQAASAPSVDLSLGALELDARRLEAQGQDQAAASKWRVLRTRAEELGHRQLVDEASGWLTRV